MKVQTDDEVLLANIVRGDRSALEELYDRYERVVYGFAYRCTGDVTAAEEIVQDVFLKVWRTTAQYDVSKGKISTWLLTITKSASIDHHRRKRKNVAAPGNEEALVTMPDPSPGPEQEVEMLQLRTMVRKVIQELPVEQKVVVENMYFRGLTQQQIAEDLGVSVGTVKSRVRLAMNKLRERLPIHKGGADRYV